MAVDFLAKGAIFFERDRHGLVRLKSNSSLDMPSLPMQTDSQALK